LYHNFTDLSNQKSLEFINLQNSSISIDGIQSTTPSLIVAPELFLKYDWKNNFFAEVSVQYTISSLTFYSITSHKYTDHLNNLIEISQDQDLVSDLSFVIPSVRLGYRFFKTKLIRPVIYAGIDTPIKVGFNVDPASLVLPDKAEEIGYLMNSVSPMIISYRVGVELQLYNLILGASYRSNILQIDSSEDPFYSSFQSLQLYLGLNLFNISTTRNQYE
jgi:hypothetical protein